MSCNGKSADFGFVSCNDNGRRSSSSAGASGCSRPPLVGLIRFETYGRAGHAIGLSRSIRLHSMCPLDWSPLMDTSCCACIHSWLSCLLGWSSMTTRWELFSTHLLLTCWWRPNSFWAHVHAGHGAGQLYSAVQFGSLRILTIFAFLPIAELDSAVNFGWIVRKSLDIWGLVKCGTGVQ